MSFGNFRMNFLYDVHHAYHEPFYFPRASSSTGDPKQPGRSKNRKYLRQKMKGTWQEDAYFYDKFFPLRGPTRTHALAVKEAHYSEVTKRWKRITVKPKSSASLVAPLRRLLNIILEQWGISANQRLFLKPDPHTMEVSRAPLPTPDLILVGAGPAFIAESSERLVPEYSCGMAPVQIMPESEYRYTRRHLSAVHVNEIFQKQDNRRFVYALILTESYLRVFMFDPSGCVVAPRLDYHARPADFCAVIAGIASLDEVMAGFDTSFILDDKLDPRIWTMERLAGGPPRAVSYRVKSRLFKAPRFVSRATGCWLVETVDEPHEQYVIKDAWIAPSETQNEMEGNLITHANKKGVVRGLVRIHHQARISVPGRSGDTVVKNRRIRKNTPTDGMEAVQDRIHTRIVMKTYGKPIWKFSCRKELLLAFHDAVQAHRNLYQVAGILHRDVSIGNILINIASQPEDGDRGILIDLDFAVHLDKLETGPKSVGTRRYMSHNILRGGSTHSHLDDLESFYYVLCRLVCEYDGPGNISASRIEKIPQLLEDWDSSTDGSAKSTHIRNEFDLPIQPWFGETFRELLMRLHGFFQCRMKFDGPRPHPESDYEEFIGHIRNSIEKLENVGEPASSQQLVSEVAHDVLPTNTRKRKAFDKDVVPGQPRTKRIALAPVRQVRGPAVQRPRRSKAKYQLT